MFDELDALEGKLVEEGRLAGLAAERVAKRDIELPIDADAQSRSEGFALGVEFGYIHGCCKAWLCASSSDPLLFSKRAVNAVRSLLSLLEASLLEAPGTAGCSNRDSGPPVPTAGSRENVRRDDDAGSVRACGDSGAAGTGGRTACGSGGSGGDRGDDGGDEKAIDESNRRTSRTMCDQIRDVPRSGAGRGDTNRRKRDEREDARREGGRDDTQEEGRASGDAGLTNDGLEGGLTRDDMVRFRQRFKLVQAQCGLGAWLAENVGAMPGEERSTHANLSF